MSKRMNESLVISNGSKLTLTEIADFCLERTSITDFQIMIYQRSEDSFFLPFVNHYPDGQLELYFGNYFEKVFSKRSPDDFLLVSSPTNAESVLNCLQYRQLKSVILYHYGSRSDKGPFKVSDIIPYGLPNCSLFFPHALTDCNSIPFNYNRYIGNGNIGDCNIVYPDTSSKRRAFSRGVGPEPTKFLTLKKERIGNSVEQTIETNHDINPSLPFVVVDDLIDGGASFINIKTILEDCFNTKINISLICPHSIFSSPNKFREMNNPYFNIITTNSYHWFTRDLNIARLEVIDCFTIPEIRKEIFGEE